MSRDVSIDATNELDIPNRFAGAIRLYALVDAMRREYDFSKGKRNPYAARLNRPVTIRLDDSTIGYFKDLARELEIPYQTLINLYLRECAGTKRRLAMEWKTTRRGAT